MENLHWRSAVGFMERIRKPSRRGKEMRKVKRREKGSIRPFRSIGWLFNMFSWCSRSLLFVALSDLTVYNCWLRLYVPPVQQWVKISKQHTKAQQKYTMFVIYERIYIFGFSMVDLLFSCLHSIFALNQFSWRCFHRTSGMKQCCTVIGRISQSHHRWSSGNECA